MRPSLTFALVLVSLLAGCASPERTDTADTDVVEEPPATEEYTYTFRGEGTLAATVSAADVQLVSFGDTVSVSFDVPGTATLFETEFEWDRGLAGAPTMRLELRAGDEVLAEAAGPSPLHLGVGDVAWTHGTYDLWISYDGMVVATTGQPFSFEGRFQAES